MGEFIKEHFNNDICETKWEKTNCKADFYDIRYKGKKWSRDEISKDGKSLTKEFSDWMNKNLKDPKFDWNCFVNENLISDFERIKKRSSPETFRFSEIPFSIGFSGGLTIHVETQKVRYSFDIKSKGYLSKSYREKYFDLKMDENGCYYIILMNEDVVKFDGYDYDGEKFIKNPCSIKK